MSVSEFIQAMVEAGIKAEQGFEIIIEHDETRRELRTQRNKLKDQLDHSRERIDELEERLYQGERAVIREFVADHPGASYGEIIQYVIDTVPERVIHHIEDMEGNDIVVGEGDLFYPIGGNGG